MEGTEVGTNVEVRLGDTDGCTEGSKLIRREGRSLGIVVGELVDSVGLMEGSKLIVREGSILGIVVGATVNSVVGCMEGSKLISREGCALRIVLGVFVDSVGCMEGSKLIMREGSALGIELGVSVGFSDGLDVTLSQYPPRTLSRQNMHASQFSGQPLASGPPSHDSSPSFSRLSASKQMHLSFKHVSRKFCALVICEFSFWILEI